MAGCERRRSRKPGIRRLRFVVMAGGFALLLVFGCASNETVSTIGIGVVTLKGLEGDSDCALAIDPLAEKMTLRVPRNAFEVEPEESLRAEAYFPDGTLVRLVFDLEGTSGGGSNFAAYLAYAPWLRRDRPFIMRVVIKAGETEKTISFKYGGGLLQMLLGQGLLR